MIAYHVTIKTESGDYYDLGLYDEPPMFWGEKLAIVEGYCPDEVHDGYCSAFVSWEAVDFDDIQKLPAPSPNAYKVESL